MSVTREAILLRVAEPRDAAGLRRLAERDCAPVPNAPVLVAEADGELVAAISLRDRGSIGDPFRHTNAILELLDLRAGQLATRGGRRRRGKLKGWPKATRSTAPLPA
jgi:hypothetical protein